MKSTVFSFFDDINDFRLGILKRSCNLLTHFLLKLVN